MPNCVSEVGHLYQHLVTEPYEPSYAGVTVYLGELTVGLVDDVLAFEFSAVTIEAISDEYWDVIESGISRSSTE